MAKRRTAKEITERQVRRSGEAVEDVREGVRRVDVSPTAVAAQNLTKAKANYNAAIDSGKTKRRLLAVSKEDWQEKTIAKAGRIPEGVQAAQDRIERFHAQRDAYQKTKIDPVLAKMPDNTPHERRMKAMKQMELMAEFEFDPSA